MIDLTLNVMKLLSCFAIKIRKIFSWFQNDILPEGHLSGTNRHGYTIRKVDRYDAGRYTCTANNKVGRPATAYIALQVLCKYFYFAPSHYWALKLRKVTNGSRKQVAFFHCNSPLNKSKRSDLSNLSTLEKRGSLGRVSSLRSL